MSQHEVLLCQQYAARVPVHQPFSRLSGSWCWLSDSTSVSIPSPGVHGHLQPSPITGLSEWHISDPVVILYCTYQFFAISLYHASLFLNKQQTQVIQLRQKKLQSTLVLLHPFNGLFSSLHLNEARDDGILRSSGISWTICKQSAPRSRQINTPTPHHFLQAGCSS